MITLNQNKHMLKFIKRDFVIVFPLADDVSFMI